MRQAEARRLEEEAERQAILDAPLQKARDLEVSKLVQRRNQLRQQGEAIVAEANSPTWRSSPSGTGRSDDHQNHRVRLTDRDPVHGQRSPRKFPRGTIKRGAFRSTLARSPLVELTINHGAGGSLPLAHTKSGSLRLAEDERGLRIDADLDESRHDVADLLKAMARGDVDKMSFGFIADKDDWSTDGTVRNIRSIDLDGGDVRVVNDPANPAAWTSLEGDPRSDRSVRGHCQLHDEDLRERVRYH